MYIYTYTALDSNNQLIKDTLIAKNKKFAYFSIRENNHTPIRISFKGFFRLDDTNLNYRIHFFHQLSTLTSSGINLLQCLIILQPNCQLPFWRKIIVDSIQALQKGESFSQQLKKHPNIFSNTIINLIIVSEKTGQYNENFHIITDTLEFNRQRSQLIKKALRYPLTLAVFSTTLLIIMILFVIPQFNNIYNSFQQELPLLTQIMIFISNLIQKYLILLTVFIFIIIITLRRLIKQKSYILYKIINLVPSLKQSIQMHILTIFFLTLSSTLKAGLPLPECLACSIETINHVYYKRDCQQIQKCVIKGDSLSVALMQTKFFPSLSISLISIAEESDKLHYFSQYLFKYYSQQYITTTEKQLKNIEPALLIIISLIIGVIMLAMYLPIFNLGNLITGI